MGANYDRLFQLPEGGEIPDEAAAEPDFDIDSGFDIRSPAAAPTMPASTPRPNGHPPPPMPVDWNDQLPPARADIPRPPMSANYDHLLRPPDGREIPAATAESGFDANSGFDISSPAAAPTMPASRPRPNGHAPPPMPVDWNDQTPPVRPKPAPVGHGPPPAAPLQHSRHARQGPRDPAEAPRGRTATSPHSHRANSKQDGNGVRGRTPPRPRTDAPAPARSGGSVHPPQLPPTGNGAAQPGSASAPVTDQRAQGAASHIGVKPAKKSATKVISRRGWRRWIHRLTRINVGLSRDEKYELDLCHRIRRNARGSYQIAILGLKGGAGKTTVTVALGSALAQVRRDRVLAFDADASCGNLADRAGHQSGATIADLLADKDLTHYNDIRAHTSANAVNLEVLRAEDYTTARRAFSEADWHYAADAVSRFYNLVLADCGASLFDPVTRGVLSTASAVVIVTSASIDGARQAAVAIDWLRNNGHQDLLNRACVVINNVSPAETNIAVAELVRQFGQYVQPGRVIVLPWDKHIAAGTEIQLSHLDRMYKRKILELAAALSNDFDRGNVVERAHRD
jgi:MinD-like ATPase involved in chromosome partitioning or flagellar assembly